MYICRSMVLARSVPISWGDFKILYIYKDPTFLRSIYKSIHQWIGHLGYLGINMRVDLNQRSLKLSLTVHKRRSVGTGTAPFLVA